MAEYIDKQAVYDVACRGCTRHGDEPMSCFDSEPCERLIYEFVTAPAADVSPVRHGRWEGTADGYADGELVYDMWNCSECGFDADGAEERPDWKFCPHCGSLMDGGADNGE